MTMRKRFLIYSLLFLVCIPPACRADVLQQVVIVTRHGVRAPTWAPERLNQYSASPWPDFGVPPGYLTPHGRKLMKLFGDYYRDLYSASGILGEQNCGDAKRTSFWADTDQRTIETARALAESMLRGCKIEVNAKAAGASDPLFNAVEAGVAKPDANLSQAAVQGRIGPRMDALLDAYRPAFQLLQHVLNGEGKVPKLIFDEPLTLGIGKGSVTMNGTLATASTFTENLLLEYTNGFSGEQLGWGRPSANDLEEVLALHTAYAELMRRTPYLAKARGSNLLNHVLETMEQSVTQKERRGALGPLGGRIVVIVGHDTNLSNLSGMLDLSWVVSSHQPNDVPPGGALIFSLWKSSTGQYSVRLQFAVQTLDQMHNATPLTIQSPPVIVNLFVPSCSEAGEGYPCKWTNFRQAAKNTIEPAFVEK